MVSLVPLTLCVEDVLPYEPLVVPYWNHAVVDAPFALTVPLSVAEFVEIFVAAPVETIRAVPALYVTVIVSVPELPASSFAVTVMVLSPLERLMPEIVQLAVPLAEPFTPLLLLHVTLLIPLTLSDALPPRLIVLLVVVYVVSVVGLVMFTVGTVVSRVIVAFAVLETFPAASLYHA